MPRNMYDPRWYGDTANVWQFQVATSTVELLSRCFLQAILIFLRTQYLIQRKMSEIQQLSVSFLSTTLSLTSNKLVSVSYQIIISFPQLTTNSTILSHSSRCHTDTETEVALGGQVG